MSAMICVVLVCLLCLCSVECEGAVSTELTDEQRSALKQNSNPVISSALRLPEQDMQWWRDARVGMFIHWGLYAIPGEGEWVMHNQKIPAAEYAKLTGKFAATKFNAQEWASVARSGGLRYMVFTARHHDGFALWDSPSSEGHFTSMNTPAHRDIVAEYTRAAQEAGLRVGLYYSPMDWRFPGYFKPLEEAASAQRMKQQVYGQVRELMSQYGQIDILWYDGGWLAHKGSDADAAWLWEPIKLNTMVRQLQPKVVISPRSGWEGDFRCEEGGGEIKGAIRPYAWEKCLSITGFGWGYSRRGTTMSLHEILTHVVNAAVRDGNTLLNVGPDPEGEIVASQAQRLKELGQWLQQYGQSIYGTRGGPFQPVDGVYGATSRGTQVYIHVLRWPGDAITLPAIPAKVVGNSVLTGGSCTVRQTEDGITISVPAQYRQETDTIIQLDLSEALAVQHTR